ncbi:MAG: hypothetical protein NUW23_02520 [Firmicutes bacterium]|nr:hypothetical protein [Bacillota bacterium]
MSHYLHCILVEVESCLPKNASISDYTQERLEALLRAEAMNATALYQGEVFDGRTEESAGRWRDEFPGRGVVMGCKEPERFLKLLEEYSRLPLEKALEAIRLARGTEWSWRTMEQVRAGGYVVSPDPANGTDGLYWSARPAGPLTVDEDFIKKVWDGRIPGYPVAYNLKKALDLADGQYRTDSCFFSVPDEDAKASAETLDAARKNPQAYALVFCDYYR